ncbi:polynucleotide kinase 3 phosphatase-domain-containing protein [Mycena rebaudengoi]|nr:polynucleotide kinase 3 phosphatase-domain-containing protein [Mycena rebaudengoi]
MVEPSGSKKRTASQLVSDDNPASKKLSKVHPFFSKASESAAAGPFQWLKPLGSNGSCLHAINLNPQSSTKVAAFDLDGTVIASLPFSAPPLQWHWWNPAIPKKLAEVADEGYAIVIISNQATGAKIKKWKEKIALVAAALPAVPFRLLAATARDNYRKPMIGMWQELEKIYAEEGIQIDKSSSFFVGDAAGRHYANSTKDKDFAATDRKWALNVEIPFYTPEEYFLGNSSGSEFYTERVSCLFSSYMYASLRATCYMFNFIPEKIVPLFTPSSSPLLPHPPVQELILFVGYPCLGKTTFFRQYFEAAGYLHINQDTLKTRDKCVKAVQAELKAGNKCVVDNTNRDAFTRKFYIDAAKKAGVPVRCMEFTGSFDLAWHNNLYRAYVLPASVAAREPAREVLPKLAFTTFKDSYEPPELSKINWVFNGTAEERKAWSQWLQIDGKY